MNKTDPESMGRGGFVGLLHDLNRGRFINEVDEALRGLVVAAAELGGKGKITVELAFDTALGRSATSTITGRVKTVLPVERPKPLTRFLMPDGRVIDEDPDQMEMDLRDGEEDSGGDGAKSKVTRLKRGA